MSAQPPKIDPRTAAQITALLAGTADQPGLLTAYTTHPEAPSRRFPFAAWSEIDPVTDAPQGRSAALIGIFARFAEILIERLNRVPEKGFLAFLDLLGAERLPPQPARVALTFTLAAGSAIDAEVPAGTRVAAPPPAGAKDPVEFETEQALSVTAARLDRLVALEPALDRYGDWSAVGGGFPVFAGDHSIEHILYIGDDQLLGYPEDLTNLTIEVDLAEDIANDADPREVVWEAWDGNGWQDLEITDGTTNLTRSGAVALGQITPQSQPAVNGQTGRWLRCRLRTPINPTATFLEGMVRDSQLPKIKHISIKAELNRPVDPGIASDLGFANGLPLDLGKEFFPFGEQPQRYDTLYLASAEAFSKDAASSHSDNSADIELAVVLANSYLLGGPNAVRPSVDLELVWECWDGATWKQVGTSAAPTDWLALIELDKAPVVTEARQERFMVLQGRVQVGAQLTAKSKQGEDAITDLKVEADGRFVVRALLVAGLNLIELEAAAVGRSECLWVAVFVGDADVVLTPTIPALPEDEDQEKIRIKIAIDGSGASSVETLQVTSGRHDDLATAKRGERLSVELPVTLEPGRNQLLIEALDASGGCVAATTAMIGRRASAPDAIDHFSDGTYALTQSGIVAFRLPDTTATTAVNGQDGYWVRARLITGDYGQAASYVLKDPLKPEEGFLLVPASFRPPIIRSLRVGYKVTAQRTPPLCLAYNQLGYTDCASAGSNDGDPFSPFTAGSKDDRPALYLGLSLPSGRPPSARSGLSLYAHQEEALFGSAPADGLPTPSSDASGPAVVNWEYWNGGRWAQLRVDDGSQGFTRSGLLTLLPPADFSKRALFGQERWWLRARWDRGQYARPPRLSWLRLNTTSAVQAVTVTNETLGSSNGTEGQRFKTARKPVLAGQQLEVREPERPGAEEGAALAAEEGSDAIRIVQDAAGRTREVWVRWHEVPDLYGSGPADRHYVINHMTGELRFGDGVNGRIPPPGASNLRLARYRTGGGSVGNAAPSTIAQLKTTVPYVDKVGNPEVAAGGAEAETNEAVLERMPRTLRHRGRAVALEDFEDLALLASTEVARARCVPLRDLAADWLGETFAAGAVSVIVVPRSDAAKPLPTETLLERVRAYLAARADATAAVSVVGPAYLKVSVRAEIAVISATAASAVERGVRARLDAFLHPLTGGLDQCGWDFGRSPHRSDFYTLIEQVPGVDHCRRLELEETEDHDGVRRSGRFLVYSGEHVITPVFADT